MEMRAKGVHAVVSNKPIRHFHHHPYESTGFLISKSLFARVA